jgi:predicted dehydrogenase
VETARRFLAMLRAPPEVGAELATVEEAATVQRILSAAMASEDTGRRVLLG